MNRQLNYLYTLLEISSQPTGFTDGFTVGKIPKRN